MDYKKAFYKLVDIIFPKNITCYNCGINILYGNEYILCNKCYVDFLNEKTNYYFSFASTSDHAEFTLQRNLSIKDSEIISLFKFEGIARKLLIDLKFNFQKENAIIIANALAYEASKLDIDLITCVPISKSSMLERGFNQSLLIATELSKIIGVPCNDSILYRKKDNKHQVGLSKKERLENTKDIFKTSGNLNNKKILVIDDILTTGATTYNCKKVLLKANATPVFLTVCYTEVID